MRFSTSNIVISTQLRPLLPLLLSGSAISAWAMFADATSKVALKILNFSSFQLLAFFSPFKVVKLIHHFEVASVVLGVLSYGCDSLPFFWLKNIQEFGNKMMVYECDRRTL